MMPSRRMMLMMALPVILCLSLEAATLPASAEDSKPKTDTTSQFSPWQSQGPEHEEAGSPEPEWTGGKTAENMAPAENTQPGDNQGPEDIKMKPDLSNDQSEGSPDSMSMTQKAHGMLETLVKQFQNALQKSSTWEDQQGKEQTPAENTQPGGNQGPEDIKMKPDLSNDQSEGSPDSMLMTQKAQGMLETLVKQFQNALQKSSTWEDQQGKEHGPGTDAGTEQNSPNLSDNADETQSGTQAASDGPKPGRGRPRDPLQIGVDTRAGNPPAGEREMPSPQKARPGGQTVRSVAKALSVSSNRTRSNARTRETLSNMKYATLTAFMAILGVTLMAMVVLSTLSKRRRRRYNRCRGMSDDSEMRSNFQLVNHDERLGIRTSANYLM